ncbi:LIM domain-containing protein [Zalerion maritima]|uniref:LIM domain-containing protein n=1 Tax=Zalerion maritima TaxID=339359 RepID=A0AAD5RWA1_9PEZI|nr:LIM domain-containing protein [Zalerion maritima]
MAAPPRMSSFLPTIKCSSCAADVEISMMGEHICGAGAPPVPSIPEPMPSLDEFNERNIPYGKPQSLPQADKYSRVPPKVDTSAANRGFMRPGQLTPNSISSDSRSVSPRTPGGRSGSRGDDYFSPSIASEYGQSPMPQSGRAGGYGGLGPGPSYVDDIDQYSESPKQSTFANRMNGIAPGPFESRSRSGAEWNAFPPRNNSTEDRNGLTAMDRPGTATSQASNGSSSVAPPRVPRKNGYEGFGPPQGRQPEQLQEDFEPHFGRAGTFPKKIVSQDTLVRTPSAPGPRMDVRRKPSMGPETSRRPPPRTSVTKSNGVPSINLANEFGISNPYHNQGHSISGMSMYSASSAGRPSNMSSASNATSPSSVDSFQQLPPPPPLAKPGADLFDSLMNDLQSSMDEIQPKGGAAKDSAGNDPYRRRKDEGYGRMDKDGYGRQNEYSSKNDYSMDRSRSRDDYGRTPFKGNNYGRRESPLPSPTAFDPAVQGGGDGRRSRASPLPSPTLQPSPHKADPRSRNQAPARDTSDRRGRGRDMYAEERGRDRYVPEPRGRYEDEYRSKPALSQPAPSVRAPSRRSPNASRGTCRACGKEIKGKSISSADGRLSDCGEQLRDGYFDVDGVPYCEKDAWARVAPPPQPPQKYMPSQQSRHQRQRSAGLGGLGAGPKAGRAGMGLPPQPGVNRNMGMGMGARDFLTPPRPPRLNKRMTRLGMM